MIIGKAISPFAIKRRNGGGGGGTDADAQAFITASGISGTEATAINTLVIDLKAANIWTKMKAVYPMVGSSATSMKWNLVNPVDSNAAYRLVFSGGFTFSATGCQPGGVNGFANTFLSPSTSLTNNSTHLSIYSRTNSSSGANASEMGSFVGSAFIDLLIKEGSNSFVSDQYNFSSNRITVANANSQGFYLSNRSSSNVFKAFKNSAQFGTTVTNTSTPNVNTITSNIYISALNNSGVALNFSNRELAFASIGDGLTDAEALAFYNAVQTFNTTLNRQI
jgi:hypothetical protein